MKLQLCQPLEKIRKWPSKCQTVLKGKHFEKYWSAWILYGLIMLTHPLSTIPILCHIPSHKLAHLLVGIKTPFAGLLSALVGCHQSCYSFRSSEVACSVCLPVSSLHFGNSKNRFVPILPASEFFFLSPFGSHAYIVPGLSSHCRQSIVFILFDSAVELKRASIQDQWQYGLGSLNRSSE